MHRQLVRTLPLTLGLLVSLISITASAQYTSINLDSNQSGKARHTDPLLINPWGLAYAPGGAFWVSDAGSGYSTLPPASFTTARRNFRSTPGLRHLFLPVSTAP